MRAMSGVRDGIMDCQVCCQGSIYFEEPESIECEARRYFKGTLRAMRKYRDIIVRICGTKGQRAGLQNEEPSKNGPFSKRLFVEACSFYFEELER